MRIESKGGNRPLLIWINCPDAVMAEKIATYCVNNSLAGCANILAPVLSIYRWENKLERSSEVPLLLKTTEATYAALERAVIALHPYELPEIIALSIDKGYPAYLEWLAQASIPLCHES
jgi:periplasmic divalent cation tolerance protein